MVRSARCRQTSGTHTRVVEATRSERGEKLQDYESLGVPEVWVVSPEAQTVEVLLLQDGRLVTTSLLREGRLKPARFPDAAVDISAIWPK